MMKQFVIWDSWIDTEEWETAIEEDKELNPDFYEDRDPEEAAYEAACDMNQRYLEDERVNLNIQLSHPILILADLGLWNGRRQGYKVIDSGNIKDILYSQGDGECKWYCNGYDICCDESHHDGTNHYIYREIRNEDNIDNLLDRIYSGEKVPQRTINYYTRSIAKDIGSVYGFCKGGTAR